MRRSVFAMLAVAAGVAASGFASAPASALTIAKPAISETSNVIEVRRGGHRGFGMRHHGGPRFHNRGFGYRHFYRPRIYIAPAYGYRSYGNSCQWLKRKAINTGSRYWQRRYQACRWN